MQERTDDAERCLPGPAVICLRTFGDCLFRRVRPCLEWKLGRSTQGYGTYWSGKKQRSGRVHHLALEQKLGRPLREGYLALHHCDNPPCFELEHLYEGTPSDNMHDRMQRGQWVQPVSPRWIPALTETQKADARARYAMGGVTCRELAAEFGVSTMTVNRAIRGRR